MTLSLHTQLINGGMAITRDNGEQVATITLNHQGTGYWVNMIDGYSFDAMPMRSLEAAQYLVLASVMEYDAKLEADRAKLA